MMDLSRAQSAPRIPGSSLQPIWTKTCRKQSCVKKEQRSKGIELQEQSVQSKRQPSWEVLNGAKLRNLHQEICKIIDLVFLSPLYLYSTTTCSITLLVSDKPSWSTVLQKRHHQAPAADYDVKGSETIKSKGIQYAPWYGMWNCPTGGCTNYIVRRKKPHSSQKEPRRKAQSRMYHVIIEDRQALGNQCRSQLSIVLQQLKRTDLTFTKNHLQPLRRDIVDLLTGRSP